MPRGPFEKNLVNGVGRTDEALKFFSHSRPHAKLIDGACNLLSAAAPSAGVCGRLGVTLEAHGLNFVVG